MSELAEIIRTLVIRQKLAQKTLVRGRFRAWRLCGIAGGEQALELIAHLLDGIALERVLRIVRDVQDQLVAVAVLLANDKHHAASQPFFHHAQVTEPDLFLAHPRVHVAVDHRHNHCVIRRLNVFLQQRLIGCGAHRRLLAGNEALAEHRLCHSIGRVEECRQIGLILLADIQFSAKRQELHHRQADAHVLECTRGGGCYNET
ncbi:hypothetical protein D3C81_1156810 [compost metagenome]